MMSEMVKRLVFVPVLSDPVPDAAERVVSAICRASESMRSLGGGGN